MGLEHMETVCSVIVTKNDKVIRHSSCYNLGHCLHGKAVFLAKK